MKTYLFFCAYLYQNFVYVCNMFGTKFAEKELNRIFLSKTLFYMSPTALDVVKISVHIVITHLQTTPCRNPEDHKCQ
jgi:hypothetical protein